MNVDFYILHIVCFDLWVTMIRGGFSKAPILNHLNRHILSRSNRLGVSDTFLSTSQGAHSILNLQPKSQVDPSLGIFPSQNDESNTSNIPNPLTANIPVRREQQQYSDIVDSIFQNGDAQRRSKISINLYWYESLKRLNRHKARVLVSQVNPSCPLGFDPLATPSVNMTSDDDGMESYTATTTIKRGSLLSYVREQKERYPECILLTRVGEFYEAYGIDAILLVEHCGLNPMGGKARAGCPVRNIQATLDSLTSEDYTVAVFEEAPDTDSAPSKSLSGGSKSRLKHRFLGSIVSPASPLYKHGQILGESAESHYTDSLFRPYVGVISSAAGFTLVEISRDERTVRVLDRLTAEAVACRLSAFPPVDPLFYLPYDTSGSTHARLPFLPSRTDISLHGPGSRLRVQYLNSPPRQDLVGGVDVDLWRKFILSELLKRPELYDYDSSFARESDQTSEENGCLTPDDFLVVGETMTFAKALSLETATQMGLMDDRTIPNLVDYLVPNTAPISTRRFLRRWLLTPPPVRVGDAMRCLVRYMVKSNQSLPPLVVPPIRNVLSLVRTRQANDHVFREVYTSLGSIVTILNELRDETEITSLMTLINHECGLRVEPRDLCLRCIEAQRVISDVVALYPNESMIKVDPMIPANYFIRNEVTWRGKVVRESVLSDYLRVEEAKQNLVDAILRDFLGPTELRLRDKSPIVQDLHDNSFYLKEIPSWATDRELYIHPRDRYRKLIRNRYTTMDVESALAAYVDACENASMSVQRQLAHVSDRLCNEGHLSTITQAAHANLILSTVSNHAVQSNRHGWNTADCIENHDAESEIAAQIRDLWPYWMKASEAIKNSFDLNGIFLLTAPNMSGKSTLMRATAAAALLTICGLSAPVGQNTWVRRFDHIFLRGASSDVPSENKSAFGAEMADIASMIRSCTSSSLVFVDEVGRGTSPVDGTSLAGAILEYIAESGIKGFFATHLHDIFRIPFNDIASKSIIKKRLAENEPYVLTDGECTDSLAFDTAAKFGLSHRIISRAQEFRMKFAATGLADSFVYNPFEQKKISSDSVDVVRKIIEETTNRETVFVRSEWSPPASFEGTSCLYVLIMDEGQLLYVGESDSIAKRLKQHRRDKKKATAHALLVAIHEGKTEAREQETTVIRELASRGYNLLNTLK